MKILSLTFFLTLSFCPRIAIGQNSYEDKYFKFLDYLLTYPHDFLEKTAFEISGLKRPPEGAPVDISYWSVSMHNAEAEFYDSFAEIKTGFAPMHVLFSKKIKNSFVIRFYSSMGIDFDRIKRHLENNKIVLDRTGSSQVYQDRMERGHCFIELSLENKTAIVSIYAVDPKTGKTKM